MSARQVYSKEFKEAIVTKLLNRGEQSIQEVCLREGVNQSSADNWMRSHAKFAVQTVKPKGRMKWNAEAKLKAVVDTASLEEQDLGKYLRREGLYSNQITEWRADIIAYFESQPKFKKDERDLQIKILEREILRKDKALAEASALLILEKKVALIWGNKSEDEK